MGDTIAVTGSERFMNSSCMRCSLSNLCLPLAVSHDDLGSLEEILRQGKMVSRGDALFTQHEPFRSVYAVKSGAFKTFLVSEGGDEQVTGFYMPGEIIGLDSMNTEFYSCTAKALERATVCEIPIDKFELLSAKVPSLQHHFFQLMSREIQESHQLNLLLSKNTAEERIASLLLSLSTRFKRRKLSPLRFRLPMARNDIGNYLGLAVETVSRVFTRFQKQGLIDANGREIELCNLEALQDVARHQMRCDD